MISQQDIQRIRDEIGRLALQAVRIDLDGFLEATDAVGSPQALAAGIDPGAVASASEWSEIARLLKPFREEAVLRIAVIRERLAEEDEDLVAQDMACPSCGERRVDELTLNDDGSVVCATCGRRYSIDEDYTLAGNVVAGLAISSVSIEEEVSCECHDQDCRCGATCTRTATYLWGGVEEENWQYLCPRCCLRLVERGTAPTRGEEGGSDA